MSIIGDRAVNAPQTPNGDALSSRRHNEILAGSPARKLGKSRCRQRVDFILKRSPPALDDLNDYGKQTYKAAALDNRYGNIKSHERDFLAKKETIAPHDFLTVDARPTDGFGLSLDPITKTEHYLSPP